MKIGMLIWTYFPGPEGGAERQCRKLVEEFGDKGVECVILTSWSSYKHKRVNNDLSATVFRFGFLCPCAAVLRKFVFNLTRLFGDTYEQRVRAVAFWLILPIEWLARLSFLLESLFVLKQNSLSLDVLHVHESAWLAGLGVWFGKKWGIPVFCKVRNTPAIEVVGYDTPFKRLWSRSRGDASYFALHLGLEKELIAFGIPRSKISVVANGVELPHISDRKPLNDEVVYVGNFSQGASHKAFDVLIQAWSEVCRKRPSVHLTMVGGGDYSIWEKLAEDLGCRNSISFVGAVNNPENFYCRASVFVLPSRHEGMSNALLEAQSWGIPCVVSDIPGNAAIVDHGINGLLFPVDDYLKMAEAILKLLSDNNLRIGLGRKARVKVEKEFDLKRITDRLVNTYEAAVAAKTLR